MTKIYVIGNVQNIDSLIDWEEFWPYYTLGLNIVFFNKKQQHSITFARRK